MSKLFVWPPPKRKVGLTVVVPASILAVEQSLYEKTIILGFLARALAIFRVDRVVIFVDSECKDEDVEVMRDVMNYMLTPPYIRKRLICRKETLRYAGILPPLNIPTHPTSNEGLEVVPVREGVVVKVRGRYVKVDIGLKEDVSAEVPRDIADKVKPRVGAKVLVKVVEKNPLKGIIITEDDVPWYLGFKVTTVYEVDNIIKMLADPEALVVMTTKYGDDVSKLLSMYGEGLKTIIVLFGNYRKDFNELLGENFSRILSNVVKVSINTIPFQGVRSVRTVEAVYATLALINALTHPLEVSSWEVFKIYK
ncbi:MAG: putative RNA uridine N3 methyltransferase [Sulfolobales archaeon]